MEQHKQPIEKEFLELVRTYPSPHNGQPMILKKIDSGYAMYFETNRGLTATPISYLFSFVTVGVFVRHIELCAAALGHKATVSLALPAVDRMGEASAELYCGDVVIEWGTASSDEALLAALRFRQTSRKKYQAGVSGEEIAALKASVPSSQSLEFLNAHDAHQAIWLNQRAVFDDMFDPAVRNELAHWLRFSHAEKVTKRDGLSYDCMELNGPVLSFITKHYKILHWPIVAPLLERYYLRTMRDESSVGYLLSPFMHEQQAYDIGRTVMDIWIELSRRGKYLHPFGTIVSNEQAHTDFAQLIGLASETREQNYIVFIFRAGVSTEPVHSERLPIEHLYKDGGAA